MIPRLSDAIRLGSLLIEEPQGGNIRACAITMAGMATGFVPETNALGFDYYSYVASTWPWIINKEIPCPCGKLHPFSLATNLYGTEIIWSPFDHHVMDDVNGYSMTIEGLADWIRTIEPPDEPVNNNPLDECDVLSYSNPVAVNHK
jgi:hypothetical protein